MSDTSLVHPAVDDCAPAPRRRRSRLVGFFVLMAALFGLALTTAGPASAASRGFTVTNNSTATLRLEGVEPIHTTICNGSTCVHSIPLPLGFEGRPHSGSELAPGATQRFDLKYEFRLLGGVQYAAKLTYKVEHTNAKVQYTIETTPYTNNSTCKVIPADAGTCSAGGLGLTFSR